jgi:hypothetical protein
LDRPELVLAAAWAAEHEVHAFLAPFQTHADEEAALGQKVGQRGVRSPSSQVN